MSGIPVFFVERTGKVSYTRRFKCEAGHTSERATKAKHKGWPRAIRCDTCGERATCSSIGTDEELRRADTGQTWRAPRDVPIGAVMARKEGFGQWRSNLTRAGTPFKDSSKCRLLERLHPDDGRVLECKLPDGHWWVIDSRANNCDLPNDDKHWCWNRSGRPEDGSLDVRKGKPGQTTCSAGAGSIQTGSWHGFLHNGQVTENPLGPTSG